MSVKQELEDLIAQAERVLHRAEGVAVSDANRVADALHGVRAVAGSLPEVASVQDELKQDRAEQAAAEDRDAQRVAGLSPVPATEAEKPAPADSTRPAA